MVLSMKDVGDLKEKSLTELIRIIEDSDFNMNLKSVQSAWQSLKSVVLASPCSCNALTEYVTLHKVSCTKCGASWIG